MKGNGKSWRLSWYGFIFSFLVPLMIMTVCGPVFPEVRMVKGQTVYVPVYSHIYHGDRDKNPFDLAATLSIRNTDTKNSMTLVEINYHDSEGSLVKKHLEKKMTIKPMSSTRIIVRESDRSGGSGANFIVRWESENSMNEPVIEAIMIGTQTQQGISFTSRGKVIKETE